jgi:hypothetical protein
MARVAKVRIWAMVQAVAWPSIPPTHRPPLTRWQIAIVRTGAKAPVLFALPFVLAGKRKPRLIPSTVGRICISIKTRERMGREHGLVPSDNLTYLRKMFRQRTKPSHGGRVTSAGAPKQ